MEPKLTIADMDALIDALDAYERPRADGIHFCENESSQILSTLGEELGARIVSNLQTNIKNLKEGDRTRKELCTILKAKLYSMKNDIRLEESLKGVSGGKSKS